MQGMVATTVHDGHLQGDRPVPFPVTATEAQPSVPYAWRVYAAVCLYKLPLLLAAHEEEVEQRLLQLQQHRARTRQQQQRRLQQRQQQSARVSEKQEQQQEEAGEDGRTDTRTLEEEEEEAEEENRWMLCSSSWSAAAAEALETCVHPRLQYPFLTWARLSTRLPDAAAKMLEVQRLQMLPLSPQQQRRWQRRGEGTTVGDLLIFAAPTLHHGHAFLASNPRLKAGMYREAHMYQLADVTAEHLLLGKGERRTAERDRTYLALGFFVPPPTSSSGSQQQQQVHQQQQEQQNLRQLTGDSRGLLRCPSLAAADNTDRGAAAASAASLASTHPQQEQQQRQECSSSLSPEVRSEKPHRPAAAVPAPPPYSAAAAATSSCFTVAAATAEHRSPAHALLQEKHLRFLCRSNCVEKRGLLLAPQADTLADLLLPPEQLLPMTDAQRNRVYAHWKRRNAKASVAAAAAKRASFLLLQQLQQQRTQKQLRHKQQPEENSGTQVLQQSFAKRRLLQQAVQHLVLESLHLFSAHSKEGRAPTAPASTQHHLLQGEQPQQNVRGKREQVNRPEGQREIERVLLDNVENTLTSEEAADNILLAKRAAAAVLLGAVATGEAGDGGSLAVVERLASLEYTTNSGSDSDSRNTGGRSSAITSEGMTECERDTARAPATARDAAREAGQCPAAHRRENTKAAGLLEAAAGLSVPTAVVPDTATNAPPCSTDDGPLQEQRSSEFAASGARKGESPAACSEVASTSDTHGDAHTTTTAAGTCQHLSLQTTLRCLFPSCSAAAIDHMQRLLRAAVAGSLFPTPHLLCTARQQQNHQAITTQTEAAAAVDCNVCHNVHSDPTRMIDATTGCRAGVTDRTGMATSAGGHSGRLRSLDPPGGTSTAPAVTQDPSAAVTATCRPAAAPPSASFAAYTAAATQGRGNVPTGDVYDKDGHVDGDIVERRSGTYWSGIRNDSRTTDLVLAPHQHTAAEHTATGDAIAAAAVQTLQRYARQPLVCTPRTILPELHRHPEALEREAALAEMMLFFAEDEEEAREFVRRAPYTRGRVYKSVFLCQATRVDFYGKSRDMVMPNPSTGEHGELEIDEEGFCVDKEDHVDWLLQQYFRHSHESAAAPPAAAAADGRTHAEAAHEKAGRENESGREPAASKADLSVAVGVEARSSASAGSDDTPTLNKGSAAGYGAAGPKGRRVEENTTTAARCDEKETGAACTARDAETRSSAEDAISSVAAEQSATVSPNQTPSPPTDAESRRDANFVHSERGAAAESRAPRGAAEGASAAHAATGRDATRNATPHKVGEVLDASVLLDRPFYREYLRDWAFLHLPEGEFLSEPLHVTGQDESGDVPDPGLVTALAGNRVEDYARDYVPGIWLYKPETKILYNDTETGSILFGSGIDGTFSWDKPVENATMVDALIRMEMAAEHVRKGHFTWDDNLWSRISTDPQLKSQMSQEEEARLKWGLKEFDLSPGELQPGDHVPTGMDFLCDQVMEGKPPEYQRLMEHPDLVHTIHQHWMKRVDRGEAWLSDDPFRLSPEEIDIRDRVAAIEDAPPGEDLPEVTTWKENGV